MHKYISGEKKNRSKFVQEITVPNKYFEQINVYVTNAINNIHRSSTNAI